MKHIFLVAIILNCLFIPNSYSQTPNTNVTDSKGNKQGRWEKLDDRGKKLYEGTFKDNIPQGKFIYYYETGAIWSETIFMQNGSVAYTKIYDGGGKLSGEGKYINQKKDSLWIFYGSNGKIIATDNYLNNLTNGKSEVFYSNEQVAEIKHWKNGKLNGECKKHFENGQLKEHKFYVNDKIEGKASFYHPSGALAIEGIYVNDLKEGDWKYYDTNNKLTRTDTYSGGRYVGNNDPNTIPKEQVEKEKRASEQFEIENPFQDQ